MLVCMNDRTVVAAAASGVAGTARDAEVMHTLPSAYWQLQGKISPRKCCHCTCVLHSKHVTCWALCTLGHHLHVQQCIKGAHSLWSGVQEAS